MKLLLSPQTSISQAELNKALIQGGRGGSKWKTFIFLNIIAEQRFAIPSACTCPDLDFYREANFHSILWISSCSSGGISQCRIPIFLSFFFPQAFRTGKQLKETNGLPQTKPLCSNTNELWAALNDYNTRDDGPSLPARSTFHLPEHLQALKISSLEVRQKLLSTGHVLNWKIAICWKQNLPYN